MEGSIVPSNNPSLFLDAITVDRWKLSCIKKNALFTVHTLDHAVYVLQRPEVVWTIRTFLGSDEAAPRDDRLVNKYY